jgi:hypothetical protein
VLQPTRRASAEGQRSLTPRLASIEGKAGNQSASGTGTPAILLPDTNQVEPVILPLGVTFLPVPVLCRGRVYSDIRLNPRVREIPLARTNCDLAVGEGILSRGLDDIFPSEGSCPEACSLSM